MPELPAPKARPHPKDVSASSDDSARGGESGTGNRASLAFHPYAELQVTTNFTFLCGGSHPDELVLQAANLGYRAIAITDRNSLAGIVRAHVAAKEVGIPLAVGCRLDVEVSWSDKATERRPGNDEGGWNGLGLARENPVPSLPPSLPGRRSLASSLLSILVYPTDRRAYGRLCRLLTLGKRRAPKGECDLSLHDLIEHQHGLLAVVIPPDTLPGAGDQQFIDVLRGLKRHFTDDRLSLAATRLHIAGEDARLDQLVALSEHTGIPLVATNNVHYHDPERRALQDVLTCIHHGCTIHEAGLRLFSNAERHLKSPREMAGLFAAIPGVPGALQRSVEVALRAAEGFSLDELRYEYPDEVVPAGSTSMQHLANLTWAGAAQRYPEGIPDKVRGLIEHEFKLIDELNYAPYFLTVHDLVVQARLKGILCQGRGAAANSAVCYCLGVTAVDPNRIDMLFERFISKERNEPPDIDIDFEHERREEVIQYIYQKYGRDRAALTAEVITYRGRSAIREVGKALGLSLDCVDRLAKNIDWWSNGVADPDRLRELGINPADPTIQKLYLLAEDLLGFPRHLSQHVGGFVMTRGPLCESVPIENAAMDNRTVIEWDKDDIEAIGMLKVDVLGLGMLTCIQKAFGLIHQRSDGATERRSDEGEAEKTVGKQEKRNGTCSNVPRFDRMAEEHDFGGDDLPCNGKDADVGAIRPHQSNASRSGVDFVKHCRGACPTKPAGLPQASPDRARIVGRARDPIRIDNHHTHDDSVASRDGEPVGGMRSDSSSVDPQLGTQTEVNGTPSSPSPSSLRRSVAPSLPPVHPVPLQLHTIPPEDPAVYDMICHADTIGVFQIESRAQMSMLPRLRPRNFYDLVIEVAIVRPGPIQGNMVHPYLRRRNGEEAVTYPDDNVKRVLAKTLGVPLFQEQAMSLAMVAAGFTAGEADQLRRAIAAWKTKGNKIEQFGQRILKGMAERSYPPEFARRCFEQIKGFSGYGFPESHAASFALLVYVSAWLKKHYPAEFAAALINSQPMGFYLPAQIVRDAREHGVEVRPVDVNFSAWDCLMERHSDEATERRSDEDQESDRSLSGEACPALRLGMRLIKGLSQPDADAIRATVERHGGFGSIDALRRASGVRVNVLRRLAAADAFGSMGLDRQAALWHVRALRDEKLPIFDGTEETTEGGRDKGTGGYLRPHIFVPQRALPPVSDLRKVAHDYAATGMSLRAHPVSFIRRKLGRLGATPNSELKDEARCPHGRPIAVAGIVLVRQRPSTASGIVFMTLEDETGIANLIVRPNIFKRYRKAARHAVVIIGRGRVERHGEVVHVLVSRIDEVTLESEQMAPVSRDFH